MKCSSNNKEKFSVKQKLIIRWLILMSDHRNRDWLTWMPVIVCLWNTWPKIQDKSSLIYSKRLKKIYTINIDKVQHVLSMYLWNIFKKFRLQYHLSLCGVCVLLHPVSLSHSSTDRSRQEISPHHVCAMCEDEKFFVKVNHMCEIPWYTITGLRVHIPKVYLNSQSL